MAKNRFSLWQRLSKPEMRPVQQAIEEIAQAVSNLLAADAPSTTPTSGCLATRSSSQPLSASNFTQIQWDSASVDLAGELDTSTGTFTAAEGGYYSIAFMAYVSGIGSTNRTRGYIDHNGTQIGFAEALGSPVIFASIPFYPLSAGDTVKTYAYFSTGTGTPSVGAGLGNGYVSIVKIGDL